MTNRIAIGIAVIVIAVFALDYVLGLGFAIFLGRRLLDLINLVAVWR